MGEVNEVQQLVGSVTFRRAIQVAQYEPAEASVTLQFSYDSSFDANEIAAQAEVQLDLAEAVVLAKLNLDGLGAPSEAETVAKVVAITGGTVETTPSAPTWPDPPTFKGRNGKAIPTNEFKAWAKERFASNPEEFFDDSKESNPKIKHKKTGIAVYLD